MRTNIAPSRGYSRGTPPSSRDPLRRPSSALPHSVATVARSTGFLFCLCANAEKTNLSLLDWLDPDLLAFFESQPEIRDLSLRGMRTRTPSPPTFQPSALEHLETLHSVHMDPDTLREVSPSPLSLLHFGYADLVPPQVIATRPVRGIAFALLGTRIPRGRRLPFYPSRSSLSTIQRRMTRSRSSLYAFPISMRYTLWLSCNTTTSYVPSLLHSRVYIRRKPYSRRPHC